MDDEALMQEATIEAHRTKSGRRNQNIFELISVAADASLLVIDLRCMLDVAAKKSDHWALKRMEALINDMWPKMVTIDFLLHSALRHSVWADKSGEAES